MNAASSYLSFEHPRDGAGPSVEFHLLGCVDFDHCLALQERLVYEAGGRDDGQIVVLLCEHWPLVTVGRRGSRGHLRMSGERLGRDRLEVRWVNRGGGSILHMPGQLCVYPIVPLAWHKWSVGEYLRRLHGSLLQLMEQLNVRVETCPGHYGVWGRTGLLASVGAAVRRNISMHGMYLNVNPPMSGYKLIDTASPATLPAGWKSTMGSLFAERGRSMRMTNVRTALVPALADAFGCSRYHLHTGHPLLLSPASRHREPAARAS